MTLSIFTIAITFMEPRILSYGDGGTPQFIPLTFKTSSDARAAKIIRQFHLEEVVLLAAASTQHRDPAQVHAVRPPEAGEAVLTSGPGRCTGEVT